MNKSHTILISNANTFGSRRVHLAWLTCTLLVCGGCSSLLPETTPYGAVSAPDHFRSLNGLGVHRRMWESTGAKVLTPQKLSPRLEGFDVIVLVGQTYYPPGSTARRWLENWLGAKQGRSLIYFGRDFNAKVYYRTQTMAQLPPDEVKRGEIYLALERAREFAARKMEMPESVFCDWFYLNADAVDVKHTEFGGLWGQDVEGLRGVWPTHTRLEPPRMTQKSNLPSWLRNPKSSPVQTNFQVEESDSSQIVRSVWTEEELGTKEEWNAAFENLPESEVLLSGEGDVPLVYRLTHPTRFQGSQILIINDGAPLLNGSLVEPLHQRIGEKLIKECLPAKNVALLAYSDDGLLISDAAESDPRGLGLEMLLEWPLSGITVPALVLGIVACVAMLPIVGRPQNLPKRSVNDFGLHVEAIGSMLMQSRDLSYAKEAIREYFTKVRNEKPPEWLEQLGATEQETAENTIARKIELPAESSESASSAQTNAGSY